MKLENTLVGTCCKCGREVTASAGVADREMEVRHYCNGGSVVVRGQGRPWYRLTQVKRGWEKWQNSQSPQ